MYQNWLRRLYTVNLFSGKVDLCNIEKLDDVLQAPSRSFDSIHIAGTNGKGSVTTKIATTLEHHGYRVGLFTSPHLSCFRERIQINGRLISEKEVCQYLEHIFKLVDQYSIPATFFEITTLMAFCYFAQEKVDYAVIETGLGGRLDATNIIKPILSVITSISLDHSEILGNTIEEIAREKAGIIKEHIPVVIGPHVPKEIVRRAAAEKQSPLYEVEVLPHNFMEENQAIAMKALEVLQVPINEGISAKPLCRFEMVNRAQLNSFEKIPPAIILDVGHNPDGLRRLFQDIKAQFPKNHIRVLFALSKNKDIVSCLQEIKKHASAFHLMEADNGRSVYVETLQSKLIEMGVPLSRVLLTDVKDAVIRAADSNEVLLICGSFFIMSSVRKALGFQEPCDLIDMNERWIRM